MFLNRIYPDKRKRKSLSLILIGLTLSISGCVPRSNHPFLEEGSANSVEVLSYLNDVLATDPDNNNALYQKAQIQLEQGELASALLTIDKALKIDFTNNDYFFLRGKIAAELDSVEESIIAFKESEALGNNSYELYELLSKSYLKAGKPNKSREVVNRLLKLDDGDEAHTLAGETLLALQDSSAALEQFRLALGEKTTNLRALNGIKDIYYGRGDFVKAEGIVDLLLTRDGTSSAYILEKANLLVKRNANDTAKMLMRALFTADSSEQVAIQLAELEYQLQNYDSALFYLGKVDASKNIRTLLLGARALDGSRRYDSAFSVYTRILELDSTNNIASAELTTLRGKMAYLQRIARERAALDSARNNPPPILNRREIVN